jgi:hypothetical protein
MDRDSRDIRGPEGDRLRRIGRLVEEAGADWSAAFRPGTFGCHELLDRTSALADQVERQIVDHPSVLLDPEWFALADAALSALHDLYQRVGDAHLGEGPEPEIQDALTRAFDQGPMT